MGVLGVLPTVLFVVHDTRRRCFTKTKHHDDAVGGGTPSPGHHRQRHRHHLHHHRRPVTAVHTVIVDDNPAVLRFGVAPSAATGNDGGGSDGYDGLRGYDDDDDHDHDHNAAPAGVVTKRPFEQDNGGAMDVRRNLATVLM